MSLSPPTRQHPFLSTLHSRYSLTKEGSTKSTYHLELCLEGSGMRYQPGDSLGIYPLNCLTEVQPILEALQSTGCEEVLLRNGEQVSFLEFLLRHANLQTCNKALFQLCLGHRKSCSSLAQHQFLLEEGLSQELKAFLSLYHVSDFLKFFPVNSLPLQDFVKCLLPMLPRFYSIASSMQVVGQQAHLTVGLTEYEVQGKIRLGVASNYLCKTSSLHEKTIPIYLQATKEFLLPQEKERALIMIGAGTGVAPYRGFLQERMAFDVRGNHWLFFGERHRKTDFLYEEDFEKLASQGALRLSLAFSRDGEKKHYVQHQLLMHGKELYRWIEEGAIIYVCGDASQMAKEVENALLEILSLHGSLSPAESVAKLHTLRKEKRYLRDVY